MTNTLVFRPGWSPLTVVLMVLGFVVFWPLGLAMLAYILWGNHFHRMADGARAQFRSGAWGCRRSERTAHGFGGGFGNTGNVAFDEYRAREFERLAAERAKIEAMRDEFDSFLRELHRARDKEEFDRFMADRDRRSREAE